MQPAQFAQRLMGLASASRCSLLPSVFNSSYQASYATTAASTGKSTYNVPQGHHDSDLSSTACHIGLGRRRDLTLRQDLCLWDQGSKLSLADVFKVRPEQAVASLGAAEVARGISIWWGKKSNKCHAF